MRNKKPNGRSNNRSRKYRGGGSGGNDSQSLARQKKQALTQKEKYANMARDALSNGDRVEAEYYFQHVEHYSRVVADIIAKEPAPKEKPASHDGGDTASGDAKADAADAKAENDNQVENAQGDAEEIPLPTSMLGEPEDVEATAQLN